jgi:hypothetical protein
MYRLIAVVLVVGWLLFGQEVAAADVAPSTQPAAGIKTGELDLTFTERSPLSTPKELARRLNLKPADVATDYDLSKKPYKAYVPTNYDPATPVGIIVYLGYKDSVSTPPLWKPVLDESHLIFITPVCHFGDLYAPSIPLWQTVGLALDAVNNLKHQYAIDSKRIYLMSWDESMRVSIATADVFTGFIVTYDLGWLESIRSGNLIYPSAFSPPPAELLHDAENAPFFRIDDASPELVKANERIAGAMRRRGFEHVMRAGLSNSDDLHYPNFKAEWFSQQAMPFLDKFSTADRKAVPKTETAATKSDAAPAATNPSAAPAPSEAQSLLSKARLLLANGQTDIARDKLQQIIKLFPDDPAAAKARELLDQIGNQ